MNHLKLAEHSLGLIFRGAHLNQDANIGEVAEVYFQDSGKSLLVVPGENKSCRYLLPSRIPQLEYFCLHIKYVTCC